MTQFRIPEGWSLEPLGLLLDQHVLLTTSPPGRYMTSIDFRARGFRTGYSTTGRLVGGKKYGGRGWKQALVDDAVAHLQELLR